ncbi:MAG: hypothetical protein RJQ01_07085 [Microcella sp.]|uniref:hypothetical protein n=1 Tax=Microcella sp. TaxID=1913979 RepID=UPI0033164AEE
MTSVTQQRGVTRKEYWSWVRDASALATALGYPVQAEMINEGTGIVFGEDQYAAFEAGLWSGDPFEVMIILESLNEGAVSGLPSGAESFAEYGGLCDKLMILHPGKWCPPHYHPRKTESYEVVLGEMDVIYGPQPVDDGSQRLAAGHVPAGTAWPAGLEVPAGREESYEKLTSYVRLKKGDPKFVMHRRHLHAFRCPPDSSVPLVVREISTYSHEPTEAQSDIHRPLAHWSGINDNAFVHPAADDGRLATRFLD